MSTISVVAVMYVLGHWISAQIVQGVVHSSAAGIALFTDSLLEPVVQELAVGDYLSDESKRKLDRLLAPQTAGKPFIAIKIWQGDRIAYANRPELVGQSFPPSATRARAMAGHVVAKFGTEGGIDDDHENKLNVPILEVHAPVRQTGTKRIIALAETYEIASTLQEDLEAARYTSWLVVAAATLAMIVMQLGIVLGGSRTIDTQRQELSEKVVSLTKLLDENEELRRRCYQSNRRVSEINERLLQKLGADLHDGPVQLLALTQLRLGCLRTVLQVMSANADPAIVADAEEDFRVAREAVSASLQEIRAVSIGLVPPEIERLELDAALRMAASRHEGRTGKAVDCDVAELPANLPVAVKSCLYRFVQEGLNNANKHAGGIGQGVSARSVGGIIKVDVFDSGPGLDVAKVYDGIGGQGLMLLRDRVETIGGKFEISNRVPAGVRLTARFELGARCIMSPAACATASRCSGCPEYERCSRDT